MMGALVYANEAPVAGGIANYLDAELEQVTVLGNRAEQCVGGIYLPEGSTLVLRDSTVSANKAGDCIAGIGALQASSVELDGVTVAYNVVDDSFTDGLAPGCSFQGAGIANVLTTMSIRNSTISQNGFLKDQLGCVGGGIFNQGNLQLVNSTVTGNYSMIEAGGVLDAEFAPTTLDVINTIISGNSAPISPDVDGAFNSLGHNLIGIGEGSTGFTDGVNGDIVGTTAAPLDALLGPLADNGGPTHTHNLLPDSPARDAGSNLVLAPGYDLNTDQRGKSRPVGAVVDIGAVEYRLTKDITAQVATGADDAYDAPFSWPGFSASGTVIYAGHPCNDSPVWGGWRWSDIDIPAGAIITEAYVELSQQDWGWEEQTTLAMQADSSPESFSSGSTPFTRWSDRTQNEADWTWERKLPGSPIRTPSLAAMLQELVNTQGHLDSVVLLESGEGVDRCHWHGWNSIEAASWGAARLHVEFEVNDAPETWWTTPEDIVDIPEGSNSVPVLLHAPGGVPTQYFGIRNTENCPWLMYSVSPAPSRPDHNHGTIAAGESVIIHFNASYNSQGDFTCPVDIRIGSSEDLWAPLSQVSEVLHLEVRWSNLF